LLDDDRRHSGSAEPIVAVALAVLVLGERLARLATVGGLLLLAGIALACLSATTTPSPCRHMTETWG